MRHMTHIRREITELTERRTKLWGELGRGGAVDNAEIAELTATIDALWDELRSTRVVGATRIARRDQEARRSRAADGDRAQPSRLSP